MNTWENGEARSVLTKDMQRMVRKKDAGFAATMGADGTPEMAHPASISVWDDDHLVFMEDVFSREAVANLRRNPAIEVTVSNSVTYRAYDTGTSGDAVASRYVEYHGHAKRRVARGAG